MVDLGYENPQLALTSLKALEIRSAQVVGSRRIIEAGIGLVAADSNLSDEARNAIAELDHRVPAARAIAQADSLLVRADMEAEAGEDQIQRSISDIMAAVSAYVGYMKETLSADRIVALLEMGRLQDGQRAFPGRLEALDAKAGLAERSTYVHELGEALFGAGELDSALALFNREHQAILVDRIVRSITMVPVSFQQRTIHVCASIGYATFPFDETQRSMSFDESLAIADAGMYYAKRHGRSVAVRIGKLPIDLLADLGGLPAAVEREALTGTVSLIIKRVAGKEADSVAPTDKGLRGTAGLISTASQESPSTTHPQRALPQRSHLQESATGRIQSTPLNSLRIRPFRQRHSMPRSLRIVLVAGPQLRHARGFMANTFAAKPGTGAFASVAADANTSASARHSSSPCDSSKRKECTLEASQSMLAGSHTGQDANTDLDLG
jgi:hypothetical protein